MERISNIFDYLNKNTDKEKDILIKLMIDKFKYTKEKARNLYYTWKVLFMNSYECIPKECKQMKKNRFTIKGDIVKGKYGEYKLLDSCLVVGNHFFNSINEIEKYRYFRKGNNLKNIDKVLDEAIQVMKLDIFKEKNRNWK